MGDVVEASQRLKDNPFAMRININTISKSKFEQLTGTPASQTAGESQPDYDCPSGVH